MKLYLFSEARVFTTPVVRFFAQVDKIRCCTALLFVFNF